MRSIKTLVLHLYIDGNVPKRVCGNVRSLEEDEGVSFKTFLELEKILLRFIVTPPIASEDLTEPNQ
jgi:hypothetical protein